MQDSFLFDGLLELSARLRRQELSCEELVRASIQRTERLEPSLNSYIRFDPESALALSKQRDTELKAGHDRGPFHGIPVSLKDVFDQKDITTTAGARFLSSTRAVEDAEVTRRLIDAGAVIVGKANLNKFAGGESGDNPDYGRMNNPWNPERSPSGSSGGSAAQVAAGMVALSLGSDNGGSIRNPAAVCSVVGLKPTYGRVSTRGMFPRAYSIDHAGILVRRVSDAAAALQLLAGRRDDDTGASERAVPSFAPSDVTSRRWKIGVDRTLVRYGHDDVVQNFAAQLALLSDEGHEVVDVSLPQPEEMRACLYTIFFCEFGATHERWMRSNPEEYVGGTRGALLIPAVDYLKAQRQRTLFQKRAAETMRQVDVLVSPTYPLSHRSHSGLPVLNNRRMTNDDALHYTMPFDLLGYPAMSVPGGFTDDGSPLGLQFVARPFAEPTLFQAAYDYERLAAHVDRHPAI